MQSKMERDDISKRTRTTPTRSPPGVKVIAVLLVIVSLRILTSDVTLDGFADSWRSSLGADPVLAILRLATAGAGITAATGLWSAKRWAFWSYLAWLPLYVGIVLMAEVRVEPVGWKVVVGIATVLVIPAGAVAYLYKRTRQPETSGALNGGLTLQ